MQDHSWRAYKRWASSLCRLQRGLYFRGQRNATWPLETTYHRRSKRSDVNLKRFDEVIIPQLVIPIQRVYGAKFDIRDGEQNASFLALLQHYGFPTPLLDWTLDPYIAAYFALKKADANSGSRFARVFVFDAEAWHRHAWPIRNIQSVYKNITTVEPYDAGNRRIMAQKGKFTLSNTPDMEQYIIDHPANLLNNDVPFVQSFQIDSNARDEVMEDLNLMGINKDTLLLECRDHPLEIALELECKRLADSFFASRS